jgi:hypothetical protein
MSTTIQNADIARALDLLVQGIHAHHEARPPLRGSIEATPVRYDLPAHSVEALVNGSDPVEGALRKAIYEIGWHVFNTGGMDALERMADRVAEMDGAHYSRRMSTISSAFTGIGAKGDDPGWCS